MNSGSDFIRTPASIGSGQAVGGRARVVSVRRTLRYGNRCCLRADSGRLAAVADPLLGQVCTVKSQSSLSALCVLSLYIFGLLRVKISRCMFSVTLQEPWGVNEAHQASLPVFFPRNLAVTALYY